MTTKILYADKDYDLKLITEKLKTLKIKQISFKNII